MYLPYKNGFWKFGGEDYYTVEIVLELLSIHDFIVELKGLK